MNRALTWAGLAAVLSGCLESFVAFPERDSGAPCDAGLACANADQPCHANVIACHSGAPVCVVDAPRPAGTPCDGGVCDPQGRCVPCQTGMACAPSACTQGMVLCGSAGPSCAVVSNVAPGTSCVASGDAGVCDGDGGCVACNAGARCTTNANEQCRVGVVDCASGGPRCVDGAAHDAGTPCQVGGDAGVCSATAVCVPCVTGQSCSGNPSAPCRVGVIACGTGAAVCVDGAPADAGLSCGTDRVCNQGSCVACVAGTACTPTNACHVGQHSCATGVQRCDDTGAFVDAGVGCGLNQVCSPTGTCVACTAGAACTTNPSAPCRLGVIACGTGAPVCVDDAPADAGITCGTDRVCSQGSCVGCVAGTACTPTNACHVGQHSCATGVQRCEDTGAFVDAGVSCGLNQVCAPTGTCVACTAGAACTSNPGAPCRTGVTTCGTGAPVCVDDVAADAGIVCGSDRVCNQGSCVSCVAGTACTPTNPCHVGQHSCATGAQRCNDTGAFLDAGVSCGLNQVCAPTGTCIPCTAGAACTTNPGAPCRTGLTACGTGAPVCFDDTLVDAGTACGPGLLCLSGVCGDFASCAAVKALLPDAGSGVYPIDPDRADAGAPVWAYCDQQTDDGGWTLCARTHPNLFVGALTSRWGTATDGSVNFGINCAEVLQATHGTGNGDYRLTGVFTAHDTAYASPNATSFTNALGLSKRTTDPGDPFWGFLTGACALPPNVSPTCNYLLRLIGEPSERPGVRVQYGVTPPSVTCGNSYDLAFYGSDGADINFASVGLGSTTTNYPGVFTVHYRHGCYGFQYFSVDHSADFPAMTNRPLYHWVR